MTHSPTSDYVIRPALIGNRSEQGYILKTWLDNYRRNYTSRFIPNEVYYWHHHKLIEALYDRPGAKWLVASHPEEPSVIFGFLCGERAAEAPIVHFCFVKSKLRRFGVASALVDELAKGYETPALIATHMTPDFQRFRHAAPVIYNPYVAYYGLEPGWQKRGDDADSLRNLPRQRGAETQDDAQDHP